ncbi:thioredoxin family protein [Litoribacter populi]|uniref:thioredoxin family protein n=1 Tax=Litoribacter populi TaxID=2598460 RepID=UPI00117F6886|nr:thioredoxin family protein [Litoribacter populi]
MDLENFETLVKTHEAVLFYFSGDTCSVCSSLKPKVRDLMAAKYPKVTVYYVGTSESPMLCAQLRMLSVPGILFIMKGKEVFRSNGLISMKELDSKINRAYSLYFN